MLKLQLIVLALWLYKFSILLPNFILILFGINLDGMCEANYNFSSVKSNDMQE